MSESGYPRRVFAAMGNTLTVQEEAIIQLDINAERDISAGADIIWRTLQERRTKAGIQRLW